MRIVNLKAMSDAFNETVEGRNFPIIHMHPDTIIKYAKIYCEEEEETEPTFKGALIESNPNIEKDKAYFFTRRGSVKSVFLEFVD